MTTENANITSPMEFIGESIGLIIGFALLMSSFTAISLVFFFNADPPAMQFAILTILAYSVAASQHIWKRENDSKSEYTKKERIVGIVLSFVHFNSVIFITVLAGITLATVYSPSLAVVMIIAYSFWDVETRARGIPLSAGGVIVFGLVLGIVLHQRGRAALDWLRSLNYEIILQTHSITSPSAISILEFPERKQFDFAAKRLRR